MNRTVWPATFEFLLGTALASGLLDAVDADDRAWLAGWCRDWVRGGAFLPAFRIGSQPYGSVPGGSPPRRRPPRHVAPRPAGSAVLLDCPQLLEGLARLRSPTSPPRAAGTSASNHRRRRRRRCAWPPCSAQCRTRPPSVCAPPTSSSPPSKRRGTTASPRWNDCSSVIARRPLRPGLRADVEGRHLRRSPVGTGSRPRPGTHRRRPDRPLGTSYSQAMRDAAAAARDHIDTEMRPLIAAHLDPLGTKPGQRQPSTGPFSGANLPTPDDPPLWYVEYGDDGAAPMARSRRSGWCRQ